MSMHPIMTKLVSNRISSAKNENKIKLNDKEMDVLPNLETPYMQNVEV